MASRGQLGVLIGVAYWRVWEPVDRDMGGGWVGTAVLDCGHVQRIAATKANRWRRSTDRKSVDDYGRPIRCYCLACKIAREAA